MTAAGRQPADSTPDAGPDRELDAAVRARLAGLLERTRSALRAMGRPPLPQPQVRYFDHRLDAGRALPPAAADSAGVIELNSVYLRAHTHEMLGETLPHELAHLVVFHLRRRPVQPHGALWQEIMREWFEVEPERTHRFDVDGVRARRQRRWRYRCPCREHVLSTVRHRRALAGTRYLCRGCRQPLQVLLDDAGEPLPGSED
ncbi:MAG TPA: SprT-like domain-containing protein [Pseudomonadales bacterium]|nr:SprT-like domain-containing protein [Pseudomonadales bacterium]